MHICVQKFLALIGLNFPVTKLLLSVAFNGVLRGCLIIFTLLTIQLFVSFVKYRSSAVCLTTSFQYQRRD